MKNIFITLCFLCQVYLGYTQQKSYYYLVELTNKDSGHYSVVHPEKYLSSKAIQRRQKYQIPISENDIPVSLVYNQLLESSHFKVFSSSKWLNALVVSCERKELGDTLQLMRFAKKVTFLGERKIKKNNKRKDVNELISELESRVDAVLSPGKDTVFYGKSLQQVFMLNTHLLHQQGFTGKGIRVAVLDAGFQDLNQNGYFKSLFDSSQIILTKDLIDPFTGVYDDDDHGVGVLSCMASYHPYKTIGTGYGSSFMLIRTEDANSETLFEEVMWVIGAEYADSAGADLIQSSLGYNEFDDMSMNHRMKDLNGKRTFISRGATVAASKGIMMVNSSGNEGDKDWRNIVAPADVKEVLTVGGVDERGALAMFSSVGPTADKRIKPDVMAMGERTYVVSSEGILYPGNGTSYACPLISGSVACLMQACPDKSSQQLSDAIRLSSDNYFDADKYYGYGIPDMWLAYQLLKADSARRIVKNEMMDARWLSDKKLHLTYSMIAPQKIVLQVTDTTGAQVYSESWKMKESGVYRFSIKKSKKWDDGIYQLKMIFKETESTIVLKK